MYMILLYTLNSKGSSDFRNEKEDARKELGRNKRNDDWKMHTYICIKHDETVI